MPPRRSSAEMIQYDDGSTETSGGLRPLLSNMAICLVIIFLAYTGISWILTDISGVYNMFEGTNRVVRLSLVRKPASLQGEMVLGASSVLTLTEGGLPKDGVVDLVFDADPARAKTQQFQKVRLIGTVHDGMIDGELQTNGRRVKVQLKRDGMESIYKQLQTFMP